MQNENLENLIQLEINSQVAQNLSAIYGIDIHTAIKLTAEFTQPKRAQSLTIRALKVTAMAAANEINEKYQMVLEGEIQADYALDYLQANRLDE